MELQRSAKFEFQTIWSILRGDRKISFYGVSLDEYGYHKGGERPHQFSGCSKLVTRALTASKFGLNFASKLVALSALQERGNIHQALSYRFREHKHTQWP